MGVELLFSSNKTHETIMIQFQVFADTPGDSASKVVNCPPQCMCNFSAYLLDSKQK